MKTSLILLPILLSLFSVQAQKVIKDEINGPRKEYYSNGVLAKEYVLEDGRPNGPYRTFSEAGILISDIFVKDGIPNGYYRTYFPNGQIEADSNYKDGFQSGEAKYYTPEGRLKSKSTVTGEPPELNTHTFLYRDDGSVREEIITEKGELVKSTSWDTEGRIACEQTPGNIVSYWYENNGKKHTSINGVEQKN